MTLTFLMFTALLGVGDSTSTGVLYAEAVQDLQSGRSREAEQKARMLLRSNASNAAYYRLLGEAYVRSGRLSEALSAIETSSELNGGDDAETLKRLATVGTWVRGYSDARARLAVALRSSPDDIEAAGALEDLRLKRSFQVFGSAGGNEVDYVDRASEVGAFGGWYDWMDLYGGYSTVDKVFYRRRTSWGDAYLFPDYRMSLRAGYRHNTYEYPVSINSTPDHNAYRNVPQYQVEGAYNYGEHNAVSLELEYFRPDFYWNGALHANNLKATATVGHSFLGFLYARAFVAVLKDPDPDSFVVEAVTGAVQSFGYETVSLVGGALGLDRGPFSGEVQYVPDRDLDRSTAWSLFGRLRYDFGTVRLQYDIVYDRYAESAGRGFSSSRVNMLTVVYSPFPSLEVRPGAKILSKQSTEVAPFLSVRIRTGL
jgi:tetratricopeptide (TPR) repeat protein